MFSLDRGPGEYGGHASLAMRGELDFVDAAAVAGVLQCVVARQPRIIADLTWLEFIEVSGVAALSPGRADARNGGDLALAAPQQRVRRVLTIVWEAGAIGLPFSVTEAAGGGDPRASRPQWAAGRG